MLNVNLNPGPARDPIRQQGREVPQNKLNPADWFETPQSCDRSRVALRRRVYHKSNQTSSGHTFDEHYERLFEMSREFEDAGIDLGWGRAGTKGVREATAGDATPQGQFYRRQVAGRINRFRRDLAA